MPRKHRVRFGPDASTILLHASLALLCGLALAGCKDLPDPVDGEGKWRPTGLNDANLRAMIVDPSHLQQGVGSPQASGPTGTAAVERLYTDKVKPLPNVRLAPVGGGGGSSSGGEGGGK